MNTKSLELEFSKKIGTQIRLKQEGVHRYRVFSPFQFADGDHLAIVLKEDSVGWLLSDEGHTFMHLTYEIDEKALAEGTREKLISSALAAFELEDRDGELVLRVPDENFGDALFSYVQALLRVSNVTYLSREKVASAFREDFASLVDLAVPASRRTFAWHHPKHDPDGKYPIDCYINGMSSPLLVFAIANDNQARDATIALLQFEKWMTFRSLAIFEDQEIIGRRVLSRLSDVCEKLFSNLVSNRQRIETYLQGSIQITAS